MKLKIIVTEEEMLDHITIPLLVDKICRQIFARERIC